MNGTPDAGARIAKALEFAGNGVYDGAHHKEWVIDQMVRALTGCPVVRKSAVDFRGEPYEFDTQGESGEYLRFTAANPGWEEGVAP